MNELETRREKLFSLMKENSVAIFFAGVSKIASEDEYLPFCINKNFYYLCEIEQENSALMLVKGVGERKVYLFIDEYSELKEKWTGKRLTPEQAKLISSVENIYTNNNFESMVSLALAKENNQYGEIDTLYLDLSPELKIKEEFSTRQYRNEIEEKYPHIKVENGYAFLEQMRMVKSPYELEKMMKAINATNNGIQALIKNLKPGLYEYELADMFEFYGRVHNRSRLAFGTIVAAGKNATCLHYPTQTSMVKADDLVLFDLGYSYGNYSADISRTYPVSGKFEGVQRDIYTAVLNTNKAVIEYIREGMTLKELNDFTANFLTKECIRLGLMEKNDDIRKYYYHSVSHHLGLDTHDIGARDIHLMNGNVITVEPGLYFDKFGVGVRIEDDVVIMNGRAEVLSKDIKKEIADIERMFAFRNQ